MDRGRLGLHVAGVRKDEVVDHFVGALPKIICRRCFLPARISASKFLSKRTRGSEDLQGTRREREGDDAS